jgi:hypothetical protein
MPNFLLGIAIAHVVSQMEIERDEPEAHRASKTRVLSTVDWRPWSGWPTDLPFVAERVDDPADAPAMLLVHCCLLSRSSLN